MNRNTKKRDASALKLPDQLLVRYFRAGETEDVRKVIVAKGSVTVTVGRRVDRWTDLGGGIGFVPSDSAELEK